MQQEDATPPVLSLGVARQLVDGPFMLAESFLPLLKLVVMTLQTWLTTAEAREFSQNEIRLKLFEVGVGEASRGELRGGHGHAAHVPRAVSLAAGGVCAAGPVVAVAPHALQQVVAYCTFVGLFERGFVTLVEPPFRSQSGRVWCIIVRCR